MKKALRLVLMYFVFLIVGVAFTTTMYVVFQNVLNFVAGRHVLKFDWRILVVSFFYIFESMLFLICPLLSYFKIRHTSGVPVLITYIILCILNWGLLFPVTLHFDNKFVPSLKEEIHEQALSSGYFRKIGKKVYYLTDELPEEGEASVNMIVINTDEDESISELRV